ncbi:hypothetical protein chiPu_0016882 [Chiloscyllium punctatum]|uniref:Calponin-homology (CH) domain-containing protein n=1 Tax=Chiloscyllium punctatum TaxID=137246 RepID=A0A401T6U0_CHIPU|nr:hypothetical protein [Chiloscyllium punctatum]
MLSAGPAPTSQQEERADIDNVKCVLQAEHEKVQNRTFTNWVNAQLAKHKPPSVIQDLFQDLRDGHRLLDLLEVLSGQQLAHDRAHSNPIHWMSNVTTALNFLRSKSIKLVNINVLDIVDGNPTVILGLIWSIILYFQVEKLASGLTSRQTPMEPSPALNSSPAALSPQREETRIHAGQKKSAETTLLQWVQEKTEDLGFVIRDFSTSWRSGLAFVAIINALRPGLVDLAELKQRSDTENLEMVFKVAEQELKIPRLLEAQDIAVSNPDEKSIITYISQFLQYSKEHAAAEDTKKQTESPCLMSFSKGSSLTRAQQHLAAMRELCDGNVDAEIKATLQSCEDRKTDLEQRLIKCFSWFQDPVSSPQTGELKSERQREVDLTEAATRKAPSGRAKRQTEQADDPGGENSAQPVTKVGQASTQLGAAEPNRNILVDIGASEIPGPWTEWIRIDDLGREGQTQSVQETQRRKLQGDWLQRGDCQQSVTHCLTDGEPPATVKGEHSGQHYSMSQRGDTEAPGLNFTQLQMQSSSGEDQGPAQAMGSHTDLVAISSRSQGLADDSGQLAKYLLMGKCEMEMFPNVDITHLEEDSLSGQGQGETTDRGGSALLASAFPSKKHQGCLQTRDCLAQSQKEKTGQKALDTARTEKPAQVTFMALSKEEQAAHRGTKAIAEFSKGFLTEQLSLTGRDQGEDIPVCVEVSLSEEEQLDKPTVQATVEWPGAVQDQSDVSDTLFGRKQGESLTLCDKESLIGADQTDPCTMKSSVNLNGAIQTGQEQTGEYHIEGNQTLMRELPSHDNPEFVFDQEQTISATTERTVQLPKENSSGIDQAYGLLEDGSQKSTTVSVSERELTGNQSRRGPTQLSTSSPIRTGRCDHPTMAGSGQLSELALSGDIKVCDLPEDDSGQLLPDSVSEEGTDADLTAEDSAQSGRECLMEKELNLLESEEISQLGTELHSGKVQTLGPLGVGSPECLWEGEHGNRTTTGSSAPLMTMTPSGQLQGDATVMEDSAGVSGKDLSERDKADGLVSDVSPGAVSEPLSGEKQTENAVAQNTVGLVRSSEGQSAEIRENMTGRKWGDDLTLSVEEILIRADQTDPCKMKDSVKWEGAIQGEQELTGGCCGKVSTPSKIGGTTDQDEEYGLPRDDTDRLPISEQSEDDTPPAEMSVTGATQTMTQNNVDSLDWERMKLWAHEPTGDPGNPEHALPEPEGWTERQQAVALLRENSEPAQQSCFVQCTQDAVSEQEEAGRAGSRRHQPAELNPPGVQPLGAECQRSVQAIIPTGEMISPEVDVSLEPGLSGHFEGEPLSQVEQVKEASAESAPVFQIRADQTATPEGDAFPPRIHIPQNSKEMENSAQSVSCSSNAERQLSAGSAARLVRTLNEDLEPQDEGELTEKESTMTLTWPLADFSQSQMEYFECSNLTDDPVRKDSGKPVHSTEQEFADVMTLGLVDPSERAQQGKETRDEEDRRLADVERQDHNVKTGNEISERETSLRMAFTALESMKEQILSLHSSLVQFQNKPKVLTGFSFKLEPEVQMLKNLQTQVKSQIESCEDLQSRLSKASSMLEPEDQCAVSAVAVGHTQRCREIGSQAQLAEEALQALAQLLQLLQAAEQEGASQDDKLRLVEEEEGEEKTRLLQDRALELDKTLAAAKICLVDKNSGERTRCWDLASSLGCRSEAARLGLGRQHRATQEELHQAFCTRQNCLIKDLQEIGKRAEELRLREATCPGVQWRLRCLNDLNTELQSKASELKELRYLMEQLTVANPALRGEAQEHLYIAQCVLEETERNIHDRQDQCHMIVAFLRQYQNYKKELTATIQKGAAVLPGHTSYMGKEKLQRLMNDINDVKLEFNSQQGKVDELRKVCRHLQSELKKVMDCNSLPFQTEAEELLDQWLDDEIPSQAKEIPSFQEKVVRIQELLGWKEIPLELQVVSTVKKKIEQVKHINKQLNTMDKAPTGHLSHSVVKHEPTGVPSESDGREQVLPLCLNREGVRPVFEFSVEGQQCSQHRLGAHEEMVWSGEDPSDDDITPTAEDLPETPCAQTDRVQEQGNDSHYLGETEQCRRQHQASEEETQAKRRRELWPVQVEQDQNMQPASKTPLQQQDTELEALEKYPEKLKEHVTRYRQLTEHLASLETSLTASTAQIPTSYKAAIEQAERQTALGREIDCIELKVLELKDKAHDLEGTADISNEGSASQAVSTLSGRWLRLRDSAREQELRCSGLREEWKSINEEVPMANDQWEQYHLLHNLGH